MNTIRSVHARSRVRGASLGGVAVAAAALVRTIKQQEEGSLVHDLEDAGRHQEVVPVVLLWQAQGRGAAGFRCQWLVIGRIYVSAAAYNL